MEERVQNFDVVSNFLYEAIYQMNNKNQISQKIIGIDASNLRQGGGVTHITELIAALNPKKHDFNKIIIWGSRSILNRLDDFDWIIKVNPNELEMGLIARSLWQRFKLGESALSFNCDILLIPGGIFSSSFKPIVTMSRNMLPFEWREAWRYGLAPITLRIIILRWLQTRSFRSANGVIFLTNYAKQQVIRVTGELSCKKSIIPHGLNSRFLMKPSQQLPISQYSKENPFKLIYVSIIDQYKHQIHVVDAVAMLRNVGYPVELNLVGPAYPQSLRRLLKQINNLDVSKEFIKYHGSIQYKDLHKIYKESNLGIFASSCENMPNTLLEKMAAGLPIACSNKGPMPEVLGDSGLYFDPENSNEIFDILQSLIKSPKLRQEKANSSFKAVQKYSWSVCAQETTTFLDNVLIDYKKLTCVE